MGVKPEPESESEPESEPGIQIFSLDRIYMIYRIENARV